MANDPSDTGHLLERLRAGERQALEQVRQRLPVARAEPLEEMAGIARVVRHRQSPLSFYMRAGVIVGQGRGLFAQPSGAVGLFALDWFGKVGRRQELLRWPLGHPAQSPRGCG